MRVIISYWRTRLNLKLVLASVQPLQIRPINLVFGNIIFENTIWSIKWMRLFLRMMNITKKSEWKCKREIYDQLDGRLKAEYKIRYGAFDLVDAVRNCLRWMRRTVSKDIKKRFQTFFCATRYSRERSQMHVRTGTCVKVSVKSETICSLHSGESSLVHSRQDDREKKIWKMKRGNWKGCGSWICVCNVFFLGRPQNP